MLRIVLNILINFGESISAICSFLIHKHFLPLVSSFFNSQRCFVVCSETSGGLAWTGSDAIVSGLVFSLPKKSQEKDTGAGAAEMGPHEPEHRGPTGKTGSRCH